MIILNIGRRNVGKSTLALFLSRRIHGPRVVFDPRGLFPTGDRLTTPDDVTRVFDTWHARAMKGERVTDEIVITPDGSVQDLFDFTASEAKTWTQTRPAQPFAFILDEVRFVKPLDAHGFDWLLRCADHGATRIIITGHRPTNIAPDIRAIADHWAIFQTTQEHDLKVIRERCSDRTADLAVTLHARQFVYWDDGKNAGPDNPVVYADPAVWYVPMLTASAPASLDLPPGEKVVDADRLF